MGKKEGQGENRISGIGVTARLIGITMIPIISILIILTPIFDSWKVKKRL